MSRELVIISGKGGTGKTTLTSSLAYVMKDKIIVDADADAANMYILTNPKLKHKELFKGNPKAIIDVDKCVKCDLCRRLCRFDAIHINPDGNYYVDELKCDSCELCKVACPTEAIAMNEVYSGEWYESETPFGLMVHAKLYPGAENSGNLVTMVKHRAHLISEEQNIPYILVDGSPGIGCPVISTISGANYVVVVSEPTPAGLHDLERVKKLCDSFKVKSGVVVNKYDLNEEKTRQIEKFAEKEGMDVLGRIPFDECVPKAIVNLQIPYEACDSVKRTVDEIYSKVMEKL
ncbi:ATP-binding protein [Hippea maritima]|uniref:Cobyrinic acid ac-diamide synthase n=1 Tax=Hippea maritima (strain ATCC 700847 / DSM 10411 / MH2) TaxID=760142 RepID=F2LX02_HIPMA|nr:ATP-binding protein [Hippea maritima]AEA34186.1 Cobyrinic acid ac-diamide synthase [Hippea maritima DSM 10411]